MTSRDAVSKAFSAGNYADAYEGGEIAFASNLERYAEEHPDAQERHAFVLGYFSGYEKREVPSVAVQRRDQAKSSKANKILRDLGHI